MPVLGSDFAPGGQILELSSLLGMSLREQCQILQGLSLCNCDVVANCRLGSEADDQLGDLCGNRGSCVLGQSLKGNQGDGSSSGIHLCNLQGLSLCNCGVVANCRLGSEADGQPGDLCGNRGSCVLGQSLKGNQGDGSSSGIHLCNSQFPRMLRCPHRVVFLCVATNAPHQWNED